MNIDRDTAKILNAEVREALEAVAAKHGLTVKVSGGTYDPAGMFKPKVEFTTGDKASNEFAQWAGVYGLDASDYGRSFECQGRTFTVSGVSTRSPKRPILATDAQGRTYKFPETTVKTALVNA